MADESTWTRDSFAKAFGELALAAVIVTVFWTFPMAHRLQAAADGSLVSYWLGGCTIAVGPVLALVLLMRSTTTALRFVAPEVERRRVWITALATWLASSAVVLGIFGRLLSATTHHRGLGAATFAVAGLVVLAVLALSSIRFAKMVSRFVQRPGRAWALAAVSAFIVGATLITATSRATGPAHGPALAVLDLYWLVMLAYAGSRLRIPHRGMRVTVPIAAALLILVATAGIGRLNRIAEASRSARAEVMLLAPALDIIAEPDTKPKPRKAPQPDRTPLPGP